MRLLLIFALFPCTTLFRSAGRGHRRFRAHPALFAQEPEGARASVLGGLRPADEARTPPRGPAHQIRRRSEEHTSELQSPCNIVCRLLHEKKNVSLYTSK